MHKVNIIPDPDHVLHSVLYAWVSAKRDADMCFSMFSAGKARKEKLEAEAKNLAQKAFKMFRKEFPQYQECRIQISNHVSQRSPTVYYYQVLLPCT